MKKQSVAKRLVSLALGLVLVVGLVVPVMANDMMQATTNATWGAEDYQVTIVDGAASVASSFFDGTWSSPFLTVSNATAVRSVYRGQFEEFDDLDGSTILFYANVLAIHTTIPATVEVLADLTPWAFGHGLYYAYTLIDTGGYDFQIDTARHLWNADWYVPFASGGRVNDSGGMGWQITTTGSSYVLSEPGIYLTYNGFFPLLIIARNPEGEATPNLLTASTWAHNSITQAHNHGLIPQNLQTNFTANATRAEFTAFAVALYETVTGREITERTTFNDTNDINVQKMGGLGVVGGVGGGNFNPNGTITRQEAAAMLSRLIERIDQPLPIVAPTFADNAQIANWATQAVGQIQAAGIMGGVGNNQFSPTGQFTREQSITTILRLFEEFN